MRSSRSALWGVLAVAALGLVGCGSAANRTSTAADRDLECINEAVGSSELVVASCAGPHMFEVVRAATMTTAEYPGELELGRWAVTACAGSVSDYIGIDVDESVFRLSWRGPSVAEWSAGERTVLCLVGDPAGPVSGSVRGIKR